jgi:hypothetical protein
MPAWISHCPEYSREEEFLTKQTTCASVLAKRTTSEKDCQKRPVLSGGTPGQATRGTCRLGQSRQGGAATCVAGMWLVRGAARLSGPCRLTHCRQAAEVAPAADGGAGTLAKACPTGPSSEDNGADYEVCKRKQRIFNVPACEAFCM